MNNLKLITKQRFYFCLRMMGIGLLLITLTAQAKNFQINKLQYSVLPGNDIQITIEFADTVPNPLNFTTSNPSRIVFDFPTTAVDVAQRNMNIGIGAVQSVGVVQAESRARVVVNMVRDEPYNTSVEGNRMIVSIGDLMDNTQSPPVRPAPVRPPAATPMPVIPVSAPPRQSPPVSVPVNRPQSAVISAPLPAAQPAATQRVGVFGDTRERAPVVIHQPHIQEVDFQRTAGGAGQILITLSTPNIMIDMREEGRIIVIEFSNALLPERLDRRLDVIDFATPVTTIDTKQNGNDIRMEVNTMGKSEHLSYQTENQYIIEIKQVAPDKKLEEIEIKDRQYTGEKISFNFQDIEVRAVLGLIAEFRGVNIIATDGVSGTVTLRLKNVPWDQALDIILEAKGLGKTEMGNVWTIDKQDNIDARKRARLESMKEIKSLEPLRTEFIQINYSKAKEVVTLLRTKGEHSFLSDRGNVSVDERTNTLIVQDTASKLTEIRELVTSLDKPVRQVLIESRVVIATDSFLKDLGVRFGQSTNARFRGESGSGIVTGGSFSKEGYITYPQGTGFVSGDKESLIVDLPATAAEAASFGMAIGKVGTYLLQLELSALQQEGRGEIISSPRVITANQRKAIIKQGVEIPYYPRVAVGSVATVQFKEAMLQLDVTPQITPDDRVIMDLNVTKNNERRDGAEILIDKREVQTQVLVDNGETVVLGGVFERTINNSVQRVPFFGELPIVGRLFRSKISTDDKRELLIFVTPKILADKASTS